MAPALKRKTISEDGDPKRPPTTMSIKAPRTTASIIPTSLSQPVDAPVITLDSGELFVFGNNEAGQLGLEDPGQVKRYPFHLTADRVGSHPVHTVVCGGMHSVIVNTMGQAHTWGCNDEGALGTGPDDEDNWRPKLVKLQQKVVAVTAGDSHTAFMTDKGQIYLTGTMRDANGAFGLNPRSIEIQKEPFLYMDNKSRDENVVKDTPLKISSGEALVFFTLYRLADSI
jgi:regulator of chromosome condensation